ncbi:MAG: DUF4340 domain-containing protein [Candidatus Onthomonas sp.]
MKRSKKIYLLLGILVVVSAAAFAVTKLEERKEQIKNSDEIILELDSDSVQSLSWEYEDVSLAFHRDEIWLYDEDEAFPVDEEKINSLLELFQSFGVSFIIEDVEDYSQYGLDDPVCTIHLTTEEQSYDIQLGDFSKMDSQRYVSVGDGNAYLVSTDPMDSFEITLSDMIDNDEIPGFTRVTSLQFSGEEAYTITYEEESPNTYCADDVYFTALEETSAPLDSSRVTSYLRNLRYLDLSDYASYNVTEEELADFGLDDPDLTITMDYTYEDEEGEEASDTFILSVSRDPEEKAAAEEAAADAESEESAEDGEITAYARVGASQIVYRISADDYRNLMAASYNDLRHQEVLSADFADITQIDITLEEQDYTVTLEGDEDDRSLVYGEETLESADLQSALENLTADSFTDEQPTGKEEISLTVHLDNENFPEVQIQLYRYDGTNCIAVVDGEPVSLVSRSKVVDLIEAVNAIVLN